MPPHTPNTILSLLDRRKGLPFTAFYFTSSALEPLPAMKFPPRDGLSGRLPRPSVSAARALPHFLVQQLSRPRVRDELLALPRLSLHAAHDPRLRMGGELEPERYRDLSRDRDHRGAHGPRAHRQGSARGKEELGLDRLRQSASAACASEPRRRASLKKDREFAEDPAPPTR